MVARYDYPSLVWALALVWLIWVVVPVFCTILGALVIVASGISIVLREAARSR